MFKFALKNMKVRLVRIILVALSIVISAGVGVLAYNTAEQVNDGIAGTAGYYSAIIGPAGSSTQLAMNTMYFTDSPLGTIPYELVSKLAQDSRVKSVIPFAMADNYNGFSVVGTSMEFISTKTLAEGEGFADNSSCDVVLGYTVAKVNNLKVGDRLYTSHSVGEEHKTPLTVVGILEESYTVYDNVLFTGLKTIWDLHAEEEEGEEHEGHEEHDHESMSGMVCAILVKTTNPGTAMAVVNEYNNSIFTDKDGDSFSLQAIEPMAAVRAVLEDADTTKYIVFVLCGIILLMNVLVIVIITLLNMYHSTKEIELMRLIGISMKKINLLYLIQNSITGVAAIGLAFGLSRLCLVLMKGYVANMGVVLNAGKVYPAELLILVVIFAVSVLPTMICTAIMANSDKNGR